MSTETGPKKSRASEALRRKFDSKWGEQAKCSERSKIPAVRLSRIADGKAICHAHEAARLVEEGIPSHWWDESPDTEDEKGTDSQKPAEPAA